MNKLRQTLQSHYSLILIVALVVGLFTSNMSLRKDIRVLREGIVVLASNQMMLIDGYVEIDQFLQEKYSAI